MLMPPHWSPPLLPWIVPVEDSGRVNPKLKHTLQEAPATARLLEAILFELHFVHLVYCVSAYRNLET